MANKVLIMLVNANPDIPATLAPPFYQAAVAAAMEFEVEVYFASRTVLLLRKGVAESLYPGQRTEKSVYAFMQDAHEAGAKFYACAAGVQEHGIDERTAIPELDGLRGGAAFISEAVQEGVVTLTY
jgi:predicted peroxiredoxin